jgi:hypothetical protein
MIKGGCGNSFMIIEFDGYTIICPNTPEGWASIFMKIKNNIVAAISLLHDF